MENKAIAQSFKLYSQLMDLHKENPFRTKAMASAAFKIDKLPFAAATLSFDELSEQPGIGKSTAEKIISLIQTGSFTDLDKLISKTPEGILEMLQIKGLGPKKIQTIWHDLEIESVGELLYACNENRLIEAKGFGLKTQEDIRKAIEFNKAHKGVFLYAKVEKIAQPLYNKLLSTFTEELSSPTGEYRRKTEIINSLELITTANLTEVQKLIESVKEYENVEVTENKINFTTDTGLKCSIRKTTKDRFALDLLLSTGSIEHVTELQAIEKELPALSTEHEIYNSLGLAYIEPELREGLAEINWAKNNLLPELITYQDLRGSLHNHSTYSDGVHTLKEMALYCKNELNLEYLGICDHSKTAVYAGGLTVEDLQKQWQEIDNLNKELAPFKIFKGIESDILGDGSLDYPEEILKEFDFVVASVHSNLKMDEKKATERLLKAIENPYTTILGHPTGRLLLSRAGYALDFRRIIDACAAHNVVIEINANPLRLDLDWRWHQYALEKGVLLSINPDAHRTEGLLDMHYGIHVARKGGLTANKCLNTFSIEKLQQYFESKKAASI